jgi:hypothetical protein
VGLVKGSHTSYLDLPGYAVSAQVLIVEVELFAAIGRLADVSGGQAGPALELGLGFHLI